MAPGPPKSGPALNVSLDVYSLTYTQTQVHYKLQGHVFCVDVQHKLTFTLFYSKLYRAVMSKYRE